MRRKRDWADELDENAVGLGVDIESRNSQNLLLDKVKAVMASLPDGQRRAIESAYFEGMSHCEIVQKTGQPVGTIKTRIRIAMDALKKVLS